MVALALAILSSCLVVVYGGANTTVTDVNVTTVSPLTNWTDSSKDTLNNSNINSTTALDPPTREKQIPTPTPTTMSLTALIFMTPTPSPTNSTNTNTNTSIEDVYPMFYTYSPTNSTLSSPTSPTSPTPFNPYPGYFLPSETRAPPITLFPNNNQSQNQNQTQNQSRPLPTTTYIEMTPPPTPTPSITITTPSATSPEVESETTSSSMNTHDKSYFRLLFAIYLVVMTLLVIYIMKD